MIHAYRMITHFLELDLPALRQALAFDETRPGLFAYYQAGDAPVPDVLAEIAAAAPPPFYVVYSQPEDEREAENRVVSLLEHPVQID